MWQEGIGRVQLQLLESFAANMEVFSAGLSKDYVATFGPEQTFK